MHFCDDTEMAVKHRKTMWKSPVIGKLHRKELRPGSWWKPGQLFFGLSVCCNASSWIKHWLLRHSLQRLAISNKHTASPLSSLDTEQAAQQWRILCCKHLDWFHYLGHLFLLFLHFKFSCLKFTNQKKACETLGAHSYPQWRQTPVSCVPLAPHPPANSNSLCDPRCAVYLTGSLSNKSVFLKSPDG